MTITQLRFFIVAAQMENLSNAASTLYISQSSLSKNIASLENELGVRLFDRKAGNIYAIDNGLCRKNILRRSIQKVYRGQNRGNCNYYYNYDFPDTFQHLYNCLSTGPS